MIINAFMSIFHAKTPVRDWASQRRHTQGLRLMVISHSPSQTFQTVGFPRINASIFAAERSARLLPPIIERLVDPNGSGRCRSISFRRYH